MLSYLWERSGYFHMRRLSVSSSETAYILVQCVCVCVHFLSAFPSSSSFLFGLFFLFLIQNILRLFSKQLSDQLMLQWSSTMELDQSLLTSKWLIPASSGGRRIPWFLDPSTQNLLEDHGHHIAVKFKSIDRIRQISRSRSV